MAPPSVILLLEDNPDRTRRLQAAAALLAPAKTPATASMSPSSSSLSPSSAP